MINEIKSEIVSGRQKFFDIEISVKELLLFFSQIIEVNYQHLIG